MKKIEDYLHLYLGCEVKVPGAIAQLTAGLLADWDFLHHGIKPILRSLIDMTEEEAREYAFLYMKRLGRDVPVKVSIENDAVKVTVGNENHCAVLWPEGSYGQKPESLRYLLSKHFDLFNLIPEGLALDKTKHSVNN